MLAVHDRSRRPHTVKPFDPSQLTLQWTLCAQFVAARRMAQHLSAATQTNLQPGYGKFPEGVPQGESSDAVFSQGRRHRTPFPAPRIRRFSLTCLRRFALTRPCSSNRQPLPPKPYSHLASLPIHSATGEYSAGETSFPFSDEETNVWQWLALRVGRFRDVGNGLSAGHAAISSATATESGAARDLAAILDGCDGDRAAPRDGRSLVLTPATPPQTRPSSPSPTSSAMRSPTATA